jgi:hypothetical protein
MVVHGSLVGQMLDVALALALLDAGIYSFAVFG